MAIHISGQKCELREVLLRNKPPSMLEYSAKGTVPVLILQDGNVIDESLDVIAVSYTHLTLPTKRIV